MSLDIENCEIMPAIIDTNLHHLRSLKQSLNFKIKSGDEIDLEDSQMFLATSVFIAKLECYKELTEKK